jgi:DNA-binding CsgD family transcriptional regulator
LLTTSTLDDLLSYLTLKPTFDQILKSISTNFLIGYGVQWMGVFTLDSNNSGTLIASHGGTQELWDDKYSYASLLTMLPADSETIIMNSNTIVGLKNDFLIVPITDQKNLKGLLFVKLSIDVADIEFLKLANTLLKLCAYYLSEEITRLGLGSKGFESKAEDSNLSARKLQILAGLVEGKTNHELAVDLGFSVSTIRHETMAIFKLLGASDRNEAARIAQQNHLI